jgi:hypothetical protein
VSLPRTYEVKAAVSLMLLGNRALDNLHNAISWFLTVELGTVKLLALLNYHLNELYVKRGEVGKNTSTRVLIITEVVSVCVLNIH